MINATDPFDPPVLNGKDLLPSSPKSNIFDIARLGRLPHGNHQNQLENTIAHERSCLPFSAHNILPANGICPLYRSSHLHPSSECAAQSTHRPHATAGQYFGEQGPATSLRLASPLQPSQPSTSAPFEPPRPTAAAAAGSAPAAAAWDPFHADWPHW